MTEEIPEDSVEEMRENLREAIRGAFYSLKEDDMGLQTHMVSAFVEYHMLADHDELSIQQQIQIIGVVHTTILKMLHANPSSLQMAHAHAYIHALVETYLPDEDDDDEEEPDLLLEEASDDLEAWADELNEYMKEKKEETDGEDGPPTEDSGTDPTDDTTDP